MSFPNIAMPSQQQTLPRSMWALVITLTLGWGLNWPMMKMASREFRLGLRLFASVRSDFS
jgi:hypothetical protein